MSGPHGEHWLTDEERREIRERYQDKREGKKEGKKRKDKGRTGKDSTPQKSN